MRLNPALRLWLLRGLAAAVPLTAPPAATAQSPEAAPAATASVRLADGFDFPVGRPDAVGYHKARGFTPNGHLGEDWDGDRGGNTDLGDPVYCTGNGVVVLAGNMHMGWGNVVMVRHSYREPTEGNVVKTIDSLYGHCDTILVKEGQAVSRGQQIATVGTAFGLYEAHLHFEIRKNINIGMYRSLYARDFSNYDDPTAFINAHRQLNGRGDAMIALHTFAPPGEKPLDAADGAYEMGINHSPDKMAEMESAHLNKSAFTIKRRDGTTPATDKTNATFKADRFSDLRQKDDGR